MHHHRHRLWRRRLLSTHDAGGHIFPVQAIRHSRYFSSCLFFSCCSPTSMGPHRASLRHQQRTTEIAILGHGRMQARTDDAPCWMRCAQDSLQKRTQPATAATAAARGPKRGSSSPRRFFYQFSLHLFLPTLSSLTMSSREEDPPNEIFPDPFDLVRPQPPDPPLPARGSFFLDKALGPPPPPPPPLLPAAHLAVPTFWLLFFPVLFKGARVTGADPI